jgi:hypothetical protein
VQWEKNRINKIEKLKLSSNEFTFKPKILQGNEIREDERLIETQVPQIAQFILRKNKAFAAKKFIDDQNFNLFEKGKSYKIKPTVIKEFNLTCSQQTFKIDKDPVKMIDNQRKSMSTKDFFEENNLGKTYAAIYSNKPMSDYPLTEEQLSEAIGYLHKHLHI